MKTPERSVFRDSALFGSVVLALLVCLAIFRFGNWSERQDAIAEGSSPFTETSWRPVGPINESPDSPDEVEAIKSVLYSQQAAWNDGDIDGFMKGYWKSEKLTFSSGGTTTRSWQRTIDRYKRKYSSRKAMGVLAFDDLEVHLLGSDAAYVLGGWNLKDIAGGNFTLVMRKIDAAWVVVHDHTSVLEDE
ncbi:MAG: nuclear transport factor 2 family protein [Planctomycetota bacterium]